MPRRLLTLLVVGVALLAGCRLDVTVGVVMGPDGSGVVSVTAAPDGELLAEQPTLWDELALDDAVAAGWTVTGPEPDDVLVLSKPFRTPQEGNRILAELNSDQGPLRDLLLTRSSEFARVTSGFSGRVLLEGGLEAFADPELVAALGGVPLADLVTVPLDEALGLTVSVSLPGEPVDGSVGATDGSTTSWTWAASVAEGVETTMAATAVLTDDAALDARRTSRIAWVLAGAWLVAAAAGGIWWLRRRP